MAKRLAFMDPLVLAIAADEKDVTRRLTDPKLSPGDVIEVGEALAPGNGVVCYRADSHFATRPDVGVPPLGFGYPQIQGLVPWPWKVRVLPARYCPAWAVWHRREVVSVRAEALTAIDDEDAVREGIFRLGWVWSGRDNDGAPHPLNGENLSDIFVNGFRELHGLAADADPVVFRIEFRRLP